jgi:hypothetical protein
MQYSLDLFWNLKTANFVVLNFAIDQKTQFCVSAGPFLKISKEEMDSNGLQIILTQLAEFPKRDGSERSELELMSAKQKSRFKSAHLMVSVSVNEDLTAMKICPMERRYGSGAVGMNEGKSVLKLPSTQPEFLYALKVALDHAK